VSIQAAKQKLTDIGLFIQSFDGDSYSSYSQVISALSNAIDTYASDKTEKTRQLQTIIMTFQQTGVLSGLAVDDFSFRGITGSIFGFDDLRDLYSCDSVIKILNDYPKEDFYSGPMLSINLSDLESTPEGNWLLVDLLKRALKGEETDNNRRLRLISWMNSVNLYNTFAIIFEGLSGKSVHDTRSIASDVYISRHAKDVIEDFSLDIYIPTYLRS